MKVIYLLVACVALALALALAPGKAEASIQFDPAKAITVDRSLGYVIARVGATSDERWKSPIITFYRFDPATGHLRTKASNDANPVPASEDALAAIGGSPAFGPIALSRGTAGIFVTSLTPGEWVIAASSATCFCKGSYRFTVTAGELTDLGTIADALPINLKGLVYLDEQSRANDQARRIDVGAAPVFVVPATDDIPLTDKLAPLAALVCARAKYYPVRFENGGGWYVSRLGGLPPMDHETPQSVTDALDYRVPQGARSSRWPSVGPGAPAKP
jgi:hypothetical protein